MTRLLTLLLMTAVLMTVATGRSLAESTGWLSQQDFKNSVYSLTEQGLIPGNFDIRIENGEPQFIAQWAPYSGDGFHPGFAFYATLSREGAEEIIDVHTDTGGNIEVDELCLVRFATTSKQGVDAWLVYLMPNEAPGVRCIQLPPKS